MPIRFQCRQCQKKLKASSTRSGKRVKCPTCGALNKVPTSPQPTAQEDSPHTEAPDVYPEVAPPAPVDSPTAESAVQAEQPATLIDPDLVAIPRVVLYIQGILIAAVGLVGFIAGYWIAGGDRPVEETPAELTEQAHQSVTIEGTLSYRSANGQIQPDAGSVLIVFPQGNFPDERIPVEGLHPKNPPPSEDHTPLLAIDSLGGTYLRTQADGSFSLVVPQPGLYHVLKISHSTQRSSNDKISAEDLDLLGRFFLPAPDLLGKQKYTWDTIQVTPGTNLTHDFGISGK